MSTTADKDRGRGSAPAAQVVRRFIFTILFTNYRGEIGHREVKISAETPERAAVGMKTWMAVSAYKNDRIIKLEEDE